MMEEPWAFLQKTLHLFLWERVCAIINNKLEEEGRGTFVECVINFSVPHGAISGSWLNYREGCCNGKAVNY